MADVGTSQTNLPAGSSSSPNADSIGVDPSLESLAAFIVTAQTAWQSHDGQTVNDQLEQFWSAEQNWDQSTLQNQSYGSLIGGTIQQDIIAMDAYSHRILAYEYMYQINVAASTPAQIPGILALEMAQFQLSIPEFTSVGLTMQASNDQSALNQAQGWAQQTADHWTDTSFVASVVQTVNADLAAVRNLFSNVGSTLSFLTSTPVLIGLGVLAVFLLFSGRE
jgi:hypothetical protein